MSVERRSRKLDKSCSFIYAWFQTGYTPSLSRIAPTYTYTQILHSKFLLFPLVPLLPSEQLVIEALFLSIFLLFSADPRVHCWVVRV